jgi:uncharacterized alpha/beta hydrolase family protein
MYNYSKPLKKFSKYLQDLVGHYGLSEIDVTVYSNGEQGERDYHIAKKRIENEYEEVKESILLRRPILTNDEDLLQEALEPHKQHRDEMKSHARHNLGHSKKLKILSLWMFGDVKIDGNNIEKTWTHDQEYLCDNLEYIERQVIRECERQVEIKNGLEEEARKANCKCNRRVTEFLKGK